MIKIGTRIDERYRITSIIGTGGMAEVYEANDIITKKIVAIKVMREDLMSDPKNLQRFKYEILSSSSLDHPNIVKVYNQGEINGRPYIANEFIKGQTLREKLEFTTRFSCQEACSIMLQLASAVGYIHDHGIIHRDIKPQNIYYLSDSTVKIGDFGIAIFVNDFSDEKSDAVVGSVHYLAPEVSKGKNSSIQSDIYALGVTFFELVTGRLPFEGDDPVDIAISHIKKPFPKPHSFNPDIPERIEQIILKATQKEPKLRYKNAQEMYQDIEIVMSNKDNFKAEKPNILKRIFGFK